MRSRRSYMALIPTNLHICSRRSRWSQAACAKAASPRSKNFHGNTETRKHRRQISLGSFPPSRSHRPLAVRYRDVVVGWHRPDFIVEQAVVVEIKATEGPHPVHAKQVLTYLKVTQLKS